MGSLALYGSGEFMPWSRPVDQACIDGASVSGRRILVAPTASAQEGEETFQRWAAMGIKHFRAMGLEPELLEVRARPDAEDAGRAASVAGARMIYFSGGNPGYLAETLTETILWDAITDAIEDGTALGGCSAGAMVLGSHTAFVGRNGPERWIDGLGLLPRAFVLPHFDALDSYGAGLKQAMLDRCPPDSVPVGIDEDTAMVGDGERWRVYGKGAVWTDGVEHLTGTSFDLRLR